MVIREEKMDERLDQAKQEIETALNAYTYQEAFPKGQCRPKAMASDPIFLAEANFLIDSVLRKSNLHMPYAYGISSCKSRDVVWFNKPELEEEIREGCTFKLAHSQFSNHEGGNDHLHFYLTFPQKDRLIFREMSLAVGSSLLFILLLVGTFAYTLRIIFRQKKLSAMKNDFINNLSHEFKTPIASISLAARTLNQLEEVGASAKARSYLDLIHQEGKRLENHVDKVLQMATLDAGTFQLDLQDVDLHHIIERVRHSFSVILEKQGGGISLALDAQDPTVEADRTHVFNVLYNVIDNALKYHDGEPRVHISTTSTPEGLQLCIADNGIGMSKETQQHIFERFYRQSSGDVHNVKGFGLGLAYVKHMMEAHRGSIRLESALGRGTRFFLSFPSPA